MARGEAPWNSDPSRKELHRGEIVRRALERCRAVPPFQGLARKGIVTQGLCPLDFLTHPSGAYGAPASVGQLTPRREGRISRRPDTYLLVGPSQQGWAGVARKRFDPYAACLPPIIRRTATGAQPCSPWLGSLARSALKARRQLDSRHITL